MPSICFLFDFFVGLALLADGVPSRTLADDSLCDVRLKKTILSSGVRLNMSCLSAKRRSLPADQNWSLASGQI